MTRRLGAGSYLLIMSASVTAWSVLVLLLCNVLAERRYIGGSELDVAVSLLGVLLGVAFYGASARRMQDLNFPAWAAKILAFPLLGVIALPVLCFVSGPRWANAYGPPPPASGFWKVAAGLLLFAVAFGVSFSALVTYRQVRQSMDFGELTSARSPRTPGSRARTRRTAQNSCRR
jgi:uncharacterized membrane protein YhaH (DUF805 family)